MFSTSRKGSIGGWVVIVSMWSLSMVVLGCASGNYGRIAQDDAVTRMFESNTVPSEYTYYTNGRTQMPYAIIGIAPAYPQNALTWTPVAPNTHDFAEKVKFMYLPVTMDHYESPRGAWILDASGKRIGIWYSCYPWAPVKDKNGTVTVFSPFVPTGLE